MIWKPSAKRTTPGSPSGFCHVTKSEIIGVQRLTRILDRIVHTLGNVTSVLYVVLILAIITQVILRYVFRSGMVVLEELQWHLYGVCIVMGISYALTHDEHIRLDLLHDRFSKRTQEMVEVCGILFLLLPMVGVVVWHSWSFVYDSWRVHERSVAPMGLPYRWILKSFIPASFLLLGMSALSRLLKALLVLTHGIEDDRHDGE